MKKILYLTIAFIGLLMCPSSIVNAQGGLGVNTTGASADNSAGLDVSNTGQGALLPRMTTAQRDAIASPATGLTIFNTDCGLYNYNAGSPGSPNWVLVNSANALVASVSIASNPPVFCGGSSVTFTATPAAGLTSPSYQWKVNGSNVGSGGTTYSTSGLNTGDVVTCVLTTSQACVTGLPATSNSIVVASSAPAAVTSITPPAVACQDSSRGNVYTANLVPGATSYHWVMPTSGKVFVTGGAGTNAIELGFADTVGNVGSISVTASNSCGVSAAFVSDPIVLNHKKPAVPGAITGVVHSFASAANVPYSISPVTYATTYFWSTPGGSVTGGQGTTNAAITFGPSIGNYYIYVASGNSCGQSAPDSLSVELCNYSPGSQTFTYTGSQVTWTAPCATSLTITAVGAMGGNSSSSFPNGWGGSATGTVTILPGQTMYVNVGGTASSYTGGFNGGGNGGTNNEYSTYTGSYHYGHGGGGASDVRTGGTALANRIIVGGGGGGTTDDNSKGGGAGGLTGGDANTSYQLLGYNGNYYIFYMTGGKGGTQSGGGTYGSCGGCPQSQGYGQAGTLGQGGGSDGYGNGGGGGGYYGGGSGSTSFWSSYNWYSSSGGGGGSSYVGSLSSTSTSANVNGPSGPYSGNGYVTITW